MSSKRTVALERGFPEKSVTCPEIDPDRGVNDIVIFVVSPGVIVAPTTTDPKFVALANTLYSPGSRPLTMKLPF